jgi:membrane fusion protein, multidrug efflux system
MKYLSLFWLLPILLVSSCGKKDAVPATAAKDQNGSLEIAVKTVPVQAYGATSSIPATGIVSSDTESRLSFKTGGIIQKIYADEGDRVQKGQLLAKLDLTEISAQVTQAQFGVDKAKRDLERVQNLYRDSAATLEQVQNLTTVLDLAKQSHEIARFNLQYSEIRAPHGGVVIKKLANEGELAAPGLPVLALQGTGSADWIARLGLPDKDRVRLRTDDGADIRLDAYPGEVLKGKISLIAPVADPMSGLYSVEVKLETQGKALASGMFAKAELHPRNATAAAGSTVMIPIEAVIEGDGKRAFVFVPGEDGNTVRKIPVLIGELTNTHALIVQGLEGVQAVITAGSPYLNERSKIRVVE